jgi:hypothetical protein
MWYKIYTRDQLRFTYLHIYFGNNELTFYLQNHYRINIL